jgi:hypothetical protein
MGYTIRFFTTSPLSTLVPLQAQMTQADFDVQPVGTNQLDIFYDPDRAPITADLTDSTKSTTRDEIAGFIEAVSQEEGPGRERVLGVLSRSQSLVTIGVPDDLGRNGNDVLSLVLEIVASLGDGLFQVDGEGFYAEGELIFELH